MLPLALPQLLFCFLLAAVVVILRDDSDRGDISAAGNRGIEPFSGCKSCRGVLKRLSERLSEPSSDAPEDGALDRRFFLELLDLVAGCPPGVNISARKLCAS
jgi:hypothetical protein